MKIGIYEQIINQLFEEKIASIDQTQFYIGSMYLTSIFEQTLNVEAMFVDIIKNREEGSTTDYDNKALSPYLFQWDTLESSKTRFQ